MSCVSGIYRYRCWSCIKLVSSFITFPPVLYSMPYTIIGDYAIVTTGSAHAHCNHAHNACVCLRPIVMYMCMCTRVAGVLYIYTCIKTACVIIHTCSKTNCINTGSFDTYIMYNTCTSTIHMKYLHIYPSIIPGGYNISQVPLAWPRKLIFVVLRIGYLTVQYKWHNTGSIQTL